MEINEQFLRDALANNTALKTHAGEKVELIHITDRDTSWPVVGYIDNCELPSTWDFTGSDGVNTNDSIVGVWEEPTSAPDVTYDFLLDAFLNDKPVKTRDGDRVYITCLDKDEPSLLFSGWIDDDHVSWTKTGHSLIDGTDDGGDIIGLWDGQIEFTYDMLLDAFKNDRALRTRGGNEVRIIQVDRGEIPFQCDNGVWYAQTGAACIYTWTTENDLVGYWEEEQS
ncbi:hypothetical protein KRX11_10205 [Pasteurellaceae bacterium TAE3-ERU1]|nr:hypothetical protein [Pasteurellaceae bacterium TAE3-ERU1]